ncbi:hypothetical protein [Kribbella deserti]|uniref:Uncharacterized protein n=1 Tax=Kribbella deserti TaxID=1926257 RepID=A0ABV6QW78_9ACTN
MRGSLLLLRILAVLHAVAVFLQPVLAGSYLSGSVSAIRAHQTVGLGVSVLATILLPMATIYWRRGGSGAPALVAALILAVESYQIALGFDRFLALHIPVGVGLLFASCALAIWTFRPAARVDRRAARPDGRALA